MSQVQRNLQRVIRTFGSGFLAAIVVGTSAFAALNDDARTIANAIRERVVVAGFTNPLHGEGVAEIVYYRRDGVAFAYRLAAREPKLQTFRWDVRARPPGRSPGYVFISADDRDDGAAVIYQSDRQRLSFSDLRYGPHFSYGIIQTCWPGFMPVRPPTVPVCDSNADSQSVRRLEMEQAHMARLRSEARMRSGASEARISAAASRAQPPSIRAARLPAEPGAFTTRPGTIYTNTLDNTLIVTRVDGLKVTFQNQNGAEYTSHALLYSYNPRVLGNEAVFAAIDSLFPLSVGKAAHAWVYNGDWSWHLAWKVTRRETVTVPAGTFEAWVIEHTETSLGNGYIGKSETWYAPAAGWNVRYRSWVETDRWAPRTEWELTSTPLSG